ncbi:MAG: winged helix-turn-helix transcriptional regulator [Desulfurococcales archaeon]|uniref:Lrp/AsnC family transcriptional regulator n=1 Tax=Fervidicoccus fontis TaxID=683846 RepID=A0A7C1E5X3_9CREN|nr:winged helix-turn-helix transcriptional regulator [Desulfurococcales archaeon]
MQIDEIDAKLLSLLKQNSRATLGEIATQLGISKTAVKKRLERLVQQGVIKRFTIEYSLTDEVKVLILVKVMPGHNVPEVAEKIYNMKMAESIYEVTGDYDIAVIARLPNINMVNDLIDRIRSVEGVATTNTHIVLKSW